MILSVGREVLEPSSPDLQPGATPSQLPARLFFPPPYLRSVFVTGWKPVATTPTKKARCPCDTGPWKALTVVTAPCHKRSRSSGKFRSRPNALSQAVARSAQKPRWLRCSFMLGRKQFTEVKFLTIATVAVEGLRPPLAVGRSPLRRRPPAEGSQKSFAIRGATNQDAPARSNIPEVFRDHGLISSTRTPHARNKPAYQDTTCSHRPGRSLVLQMSDSVRRVSARVLVR